MLHSVSSCCGLGARSLPSASFQSLVIPDFEALVVKPELTVFPVNQNRHPLGCHDRYATGVARSRIQTKTTLPLNGPAAADHRKAVAGCIGESASHPYHLWQRGHDLRRLSIAVETGYPKQ